MLAPRQTLHSTPEPVLLEALRLAGVTRTDVLYDIGCGDGRCVIAAAKTFGVRAVGIEIDPTRVATARAAAREANVAHLVTIHEGNALEWDLREATVVFLFLIQRGLKQLRRRLDALPRPCRVITYLYRFPDLQADARHSLQAKAQHRDVRFPVYFYTFPTSTHEVHAADSA